MTIPKYTVIVADPPWQYQQKNTGGSGTSGADHKYPTMPLDEICALPVKHIAASASVLFLWATAPFLMDARNVLEAWGYKYKTVLVWKKTGRKGIGWWFRGNAEFVLVGVRGNVKAFRCQEENVFFATPTRHSAKPDEFWSLIEPVIPDGHRLELFSRSPRAGWDAWGYEAEGCVALDTFPDPATFAAQQPPATPQAKTTTALQPTQAATDPHREWGEA